MNGLIWLRIGRSGGLLWMRQWTFMFNKMLGSSVVAAQPETFRVVLSSLSVIRARDEGRSHHSAFPGVSRALAIDNIRNGKGFFIKEHYTVLKRVHFAIGAWVIWKIQTTHMRPLRSWLGTIVTRCEKEEREVKCKLMLQFGGLYVMFIVTSRWNTRI
jgi:hypothetical protein